MAFRDWIAARLGRLELEGAGKSIPDLQRVCPEFAVGGWAESPRQPSNSDEPVIVEASPFTLLPREAPRTAIVVGESGSGRSLVANRLLGESGFNDDTVIWDHNLGHDTLGQLLGATHVNHLREPLPVGTTRGPWIFRRPRFDSNVFAEDMDVHLLQWMAHWSDARWTPHQLLLDEVWADAREQGLLALRELLRGARKHQARVVLTVGPDALEKLHSYVRDVIEIVVLCPALPRPCAQGSPVGTLGPAVRVGGQDLAQYRHSDNWSWRAHGDYRVVDTTSGRDWLWHVAPTAEELVLVERRASCRSTAGNETVSTAGGSHA